MLPEAWKKEIEDFAEKAANAQEHIAPKNRWYDLDHLTFYGTVVAASAAVVAAGFTGWLAWGTYDLASDSSKQLISATRAWIVPIGARLNGPILLDHNQRAEIIFENVGKEAAWDVSDVRRQGPLFDVIIDAKQMPYIDVQTAPWPVNTLCAGDPLQVVNRRTVYPGSKNEDLIYIFNSPLVPQEFIDKKKSFTIVGCFLYRTPIEPQKIRHSPYCFYFQPKREGPIDDGTFQVCPSGSANAD
jgi:hypothetical protein